MYKLTAESLIGAALFDFCGRHTSSDKPLTMSARHNAAPAAEAVAKFLADRGLDGNCEYPVREWQNMLSALPSPAPLAPELAEAVGVIESELASGVLDTEEYGQVIAAFDILLRHVRSGGLTESQREAA